MPFEDATMTFGAGRDMACGMEVQFFATFGAHKGADAGDFACMPLTKRIGLLFELF